MFEVIELALSREMNHMQFLKDIPVGHPSWEGAREEIMRIEAQLGYSIGIYIGNLTEVLDTMRREKEAHAKDPFNSRGYLALPLPF
jgi:hypothetical protein